MINELYTLCRKVVILMANRYFVFRGTQRFPVTAQVGEIVELPLYDYLSDIPDDYRNLDLRVAITHIETCPRCKILRGTAYTEDGLHNVEIILNSHDTFANTVTLTPA